MNILAQLQSVVRKKVKSKNNKPATNTQNEQKKTKRTFFSKTYGNYWMPILFARQLWE